MPEQKTYHLYHHQPDPLAPEVLTERAWSIHNGRTYSLVASIEAPDEQEALHAAQRKAQGQSVPRMTTIQAANLLRETLPGDVLVAAYAAWMLNSEGELLAMPFTVSPPWKHLRQRSGQQASVDTLAWAPDGTVLAAASEHRVVLHVVHAPHAYPTAYERGGSATAHLAWSPDGTRLASVSSKAEVHLWKPAPWSQEGAVGSILICRSEEPGYAPPPIHCLAWSPDGNHLFAGREDGLLIGWDAHTGTCLPLFKLHQKAVIALAFSPRNEHLLLTASADALVKIGNRLTQEGVIYRHGAGVTAACWSPDGQFVASCEQADPTVHLWQAQTGRLVERIPLSVSSTFGVEACALAWSSHGRLLAVGCDDSTVQLIDLERRCHVSTYRVDQFVRRKVVALDWSPGGRFLAAGDGSVGTLIWEVSQDLEDASGNTY